MSGNFIDKTLTPPAEEEDSYLIRKTSADRVNRPAFSPGYFSTIFNGNDDTNVPVIPESLPTTPGFELESGGMFAGSKKPIFPSQQSPTVELKFDALEAKLRSNTLKNLNPVDDDISVHQIDDEQLDGNDDTGKPSAGPRLMTLSNPPKNRWRLLASCFWCFSSGISDGCVGALLPNIESYYNISYSIVSLIWLGNCIGFILVATTSHYLSKHLSFHKLIYFPAILQAVHFGIVSSGTKFPVIVFAYFIGGIAVAAGLSNHNYYICRIENSSVNLGCFHGAYGIGASVGPLIATVMVTAGIKWHFFFFILLGIALFNSVFLFWAFGNCDAEFAEFESTEELTKEARSASSMELVDMSKKNDNAAAIDIEGETQKVPSDFSLAIKLMKTWLISFFVFFYQGAEVGFGSWYVTFLLDTRHSPENTRYIASGFWLGVTISRFFVTPLGVKYVGNRRSIYILVLLAITFDILSWLIKSIVAAGVMASLVGFFIGPVYPLMIGLVTRILPRKVQVISMTIMTAFGSSGGALFPFLIGIMSQYFGTWVLHPIVIGLLSAMLSVWSLLPNVERIEKHGSAKNVWQKIW